MPRAEQTWNHPKLAYTVEEAAQLLSMSRAQIYRLIDLQELPTVKIGKLRRITYFQLEAYVRKLEQLSGWTRLEGR